MLAKILQFPFFTFHIRFNQLVILFAIAANITLLAHFIANVA